VNERLNADPVEDRRGYFPTVNLAVAMAIRRVEVVHSDRDRMTPQLLSMLCYAIFPSSSLPVKNQYRQPPPRERA
jgi:hypothetical protein